MKHDWSSGKEGAVCCLVCSVQREDGNAEAECPKRPGAIRQKPASYLDDPSFYARVKEVQEESAKAVRGE